MVEPTDQSESSDTTRTRRRYLAGVGVAAGSLILAGCGGDGVGTDGSPNGTTMGDTETETSTETPTETQTEETEETEETDTETETPTEEASVRIAHMSPDAPNVAVIVDGSTVLEDVAFGDVSEYLALSPGSHTVQVAPTGDPETVVFEGDITVEAGTAYTVAAIGEVSADADQSFEPLILEDDNEPPMSGTARIRAVHASPDAPAVDITTGGGETVLFDGLNYGNSGYAEVPAGDYTLEVRQDTESNDGEVVAEFDVSVEGGQVYTAFAAGYLSPADEPVNTPFDLFMVQDTESTGTEGTGTEGTGTEGTGTEGTGTEGTETEGTGTEGTGTEGTGTEATETESA